MKIFIFRDPEFTTLPDCGADDVAGALSSAGLSFGFAGRRELGKLDRRECDVLVLPYLNGEFSEKELSGLCAFHASGGSLFFLGDLPHYGRHYPYRNMLSYRLLLTRGGGGQRHFEGLSADGRAMLGSLDDLEYLKNKHSFRTLRVTAFPPDVTHKMFDNSRENWEDVGAVLVERHCRRYLGAKLAVIGSDGGETRESVCGAYPKPWKYEPGYLDRKWRGRDELIVKMLRLLDPAELAGAVELTSVHEVSGDAGVKIVLRNLTGRATSVSGVSLKCNGETVFTCDMVVIGPRGAREFAAPDMPRVFGIYDYELVCGGRTLARRTGRVIKGRETSGGEVVFGASTYWAFKKKAPREYFEFVESMIDCGAQYIRANVPWEDVEPERGVYDWTIPDQLADFALGHGIKCKFWMFPTTRGSGLADAGVPLWTLADPAIDRFGKSGFFPTIWGELYQQSYFAMLEAFIRRYAGHEGVAEFILDHGNSDFPYGYYCYGGGDHMIFDYSPAENRAFRRYLAEVRRMPLDDVRAVWGDPAIKSYGDIPTPYSENRAAWMVYCDFRIWTNEFGFAKIGELLDRYAPGKRPDDLPGHGLGSISDIGTASYEVRARHYDEEMRHPRELVVMHNAGRRWGGEPWQVGASYEEYDPALFGSIRFNASYFSIPGADLGVWGDDIARCGFIRRSLAGAQRRRPEIAVIDGMAWNDFQSLAQTATRLDAEVDLLTRRSRFDFSCYKLMALPPDDAPFAGDGGSNVRYLPEDRDWYERLAAAVANGLSLLVFPHTGRHPGLAGEKNYLRECLDFSDVGYGERRFCELDFPAEFGGGSASGQACSVLGRPGDRILLSARDGAPLLLERRMGKGSLLLAGYDSLPDSLDGKLDYFHDRSNAKHTLARLITALGAGSRELDSGGANIIKCLMRRGRESFLLLYSHLDSPLGCTIRFESAAARAFDLATGRTYSLASAGNERILQLDMKPFQGYYLLLE